MKLNEIQDLIKFVAKSGVSEVELELKDFKIVIRTPGKGEKNSGQMVAQHQMPMVYQQAAPQASAPAIEAVPAPSVVTEESKYQTITSSMIGTFYRSAGPDKDAFVSVGDMISPGKTICIIEAMKLFNKIEAEVSGKIMKILVDDATPVEFGQPLFLIDPS